MGKLQERDLPAKMFSRAARIFLTFGCSVQILLRISLIHGASIPTSIGITATNATLGTSTAHCSGNEGWVGDGIDYGDCVVAISEFYRTNVVPRRGQRYEFLSRGVSKTTVLPYIVPPRKYEHGEQPGFSISALILLPGSS